MKINYDIFERWAKKSSSAPEDWAQEFELLKLQVENGLKLSYEFNEKNIGATYITLKKRLNDGQISVGGTNMDIFGEIEAVDEVMFESFDALEDDEVFKDFDSDLSYQIHSDTKLTQDLFDIGRRQANEFNNEIAIDFLFMKAATANDMSLKKLNKLIKIHGLRPIKTKEWETAQALLI